MKYVKYSLFLFYSIIISFLIYGEIVTPKILKKLQTIELLDRNQKPFYFLCNNEEINYVSLSSINKKTIEMFVNTEDKKFYAHSGFDLLRIGSSVYHNITTNNMVGASTITQQLARNLYLNNEKTIKRKIKELYYAIQIEKQYSKEEILESYLNTLYFGHSIYGLHDASYFFFNKNPLNLTISQSAILIGVINSPGNYSPIIDLDASIKKRNIILKDALKSRIITQEEYVEALNESVNIYGKQEQIYGSSALFYKDMVIKELKELGFYDNSYYEHITVSTAYEPSINKYIDNMNIDEEMSLVAIENNGAVISLIGSVNYHNSSFNRATSKIPLGSTVKPFLYYQAIACGFSPLFEMKSEETTFADYSPKNNNNIYENANISMLYALATSDNIYALKMLNLIGIDNMVDILKKLNINVHNNLSLALGTNEDSLYNLVSAYTVISNMGKKIDPFFIQEIRDNGNLVYKHTSGSTRVLDESVCFVLSDMLKGVFDTNLNHKAQVTGSSIAKMLTNTYAGKSGTSSDNMWMIGYNPLITIGVWSNNDNPKYIWAKTMEYYMMDKEDIWYNKPDNVYFVYDNPSGLETTYKKWIAIKTLLPYKKS